jgi:hypothetical protein
MYVMCYRYCVWVSNKMFKNNCPLFDTPARILGHRNMVQLFRIGRRLVILGDLNTGYKRVSMYGDFHISRMYQDARCKAIFAPLCNISCPLPI